MLNKLLIIIESILWFLTFLTGFVLILVLYYKVGWSIEKVIELFLDNNIIHTLTIFGVTILPEQIPSISAILQLFESFFKTSYTHIPFYYNDIDRDNKT